jgi:hypothetical protein
MTRYFYHKDYTLWFIVPYNFGITLTTVIIDITNTTKLVRVADHAAASRCLRMMNNVLWIPDRTDELQLGLCVEAHCRSTGHRAYGAALGAIKKYVAWTTMAKDVKDFVQNS